MTSPERTAAGGSWDFARGARPGRVAARGGGVAQELHRSRDACAPRRSKRNDARGADRPRSSGRRGRRRWHTRCFVAPPRTVTAAEFPARSQPIQEKHMKVKTSVKAGFEGAEKALLVHLQPRRL